MLVIQVIQVLIVILQLLQIQQIQQIQLQKHGMVQQLQLDIMIVVVEVIFLFSIKKY